MPTAKTVAPPPVDWRSSALGWARWEPLLMHQLWPVTIPLARAAGVREGARVLDVGCGTGEPALALAQLIAPRGRVLGIDVAPEMVRVAARRARALGLRDAHFAHADITAVRGRFDAVTARFSIMFVPDVAPALAHLRGLLAPRGRAAFAVWGPLARNPWMRLMREQTAAAGGVNADPTAGPHPFRFARRGTFEALLRAAGFRDIATEAVAVEAVYPTPEIYATSVCDTSSALRAVRRTLSKAADLRLRRGITRAAERHVRQGTVRLAGLAWVVSGRR